ncbi:hypothetical protein VM1G_11406 [Cytospora mali]|uniref:Uncharacterized protein n=1 Tax=Cytospora mali TaxID=578113 RepID=A0A194VR47_CYTMA|nr:hypothetical protein VM1G_11406 [Valsa mali]
MWIKDANHNDDHDSDKDDEDHEHDDHDDHDGLNPTYWVAAVITQLSDFMITRGLRYGYHGADMDMDMDTIPTTHYEASRLACSQPWSTLTQNTQGTPTVGCATNANYNLSEIKRTPTATKDATSPSTDKEEKENPRNDRGHFCGTNPIESVSSSNPTANFL